jgi:hypothetical protein
LSVADDCKLQGVLVEEKRDREELRGGNPEVPKERQRRASASNLYIFAKDFGCCIAYRRESQLYEEDGICG